MDDQVGREGRGVGDRLHRGIVGRDMNRPLVAGAREVGEQQRQEPVGRARRRQRRRSRRNGGKNIGGASGHGSGI